MDPTTTRFHVAPATAFSRMCLILLVVSIVSRSSLCQQIIYHEGFNDDGDGTRYTIEGRGLDPEGPDGIAVWNHSFDAGDFAKTSTAPAKRAAMLFGHNVDAQIWTDSTLQILDNLVNWAADGNENAKIYFLPLGFGDSTQMISERFEAQGHIVSDLALGASIPNDADLVFNTSEERPDPLSLFVGADVPLISLNARGHDSALVVTRGASTRFNDAIAVNIVEENSQHPVVAGFSGTIEWTTDAPGTSVRGLGPRFAPGGKLLATYEDPDTNAVLPALVVVDKGDELLGTFNPSSVEGTGFIVGADLNHEFGGFSSSEDDPRSIQLAPVDVAGLNDVQLTIALAASQFDRDASDFLRIMIDLDNSGEFIALSEFRGNENYILDDGNVQLGAIEFTDVTWDIPDEATNLVVRFEAHSTFPNEQIGIDNVRITIPGLFGDFDGDGTLNAADANELVWQIASGTNDIRFDQNEDAVVDSQDLQVWVKETAFTWFGDANLDGEFNSGDLVAVFQAGKFEQDVEANWEEGDWNGNHRFDSADFVAAFQDGGFEKGPRTELNLVPEPSSSFLLAMACLFIHPILATRRRSV